MKNRAILFATGRLALLHEMSANDGFSPQIELSLFWKDSLEIPDWTGNNRQDSIIFMTT